MSHPNSHHPQPRGRRRALSPEPPPPPGPRTPSPDRPTLVTKSPHTNRTIKKGRISDKPTQNSSGRAPSPRPPDSQPPATEPSLAKPQTQPTKKPDSASAAQAIVEALTSQLEAALRTIETLTNHHPDFAQLNVDRTRQVLSKFHALLEPVAQPRKSDRKGPDDDPTKSTTSSRKKTYAQATASTKTAYQNTQRPNTTTSTPKRSSPRNVDLVRLIVDFQNSCEKRLRPFRIRDYLNQKFSTAGVKFAAAEFSSAGNLILTITSANARHIQNSAMFQQSLKEHITELLHLGEGTEIDIYPDTPWHRVVINKVSMEDARKAAKTDDPWKAMEKIIEELRDFNPDFYGGFKSPLLLRGLRPLVSGEADFAKRDTVSLCIAFDDIRQARKMVQVGAFVLGKHYSVSWYRSRSRSRR